MNVFTTKDGKVYKVTLRNFVAATNKKAPYYKRVKIKGKVVEKAYAICPACGNPVHFVNLFNKSKKKKAHVRHQRSSIKGLAKYNALAYENCPFVKGEAETEVKPKRKIEKIESPTAAFCDAMVNAFGFSEKSADLMGRIYLRLREDDPDTAIQRFFACMASASYNNASLEDLGNGNIGSYLKHLLSGVAWDAVGDIGHVNFVKQFVISLGFNEVDVKDLFTDLNDQHGLLEDTSSVYFGKPDFTHFCATVATVLSEKSEKAAGSLVAGSFNGAFSADDNAGYIGDLCGTDGTEPSMNDGDYKADLDAVNLSIRLQENKAVPFLSLVADYFREINLRESYRAREFKENIGLDTLQSQREAYRRLLMERIFTYNQKEGFFLDLDDPIKQQKLKENLALFDEFINHIKDEKGAWTNG